MSQTCCASLKEEPMGSLQSLVCMSQRFYTLPSLRAWTITGQLKRGVAYLEMVELP